MLLRSRRQTSPPMELEITENITKKKSTKKKAPKHVLGFKKTI